MAPPAPVIAVDVDEEKEFKKWLKKYHAFLEEYHVRAVSNMILPTLVVNYAPDSIVEIADDGMCYTDGKHIHLSLHHFLFNERYSPDQWMLAFRAAIAHEAQHINSTPIHYMQEMQNWYGKYMADHFSFNANIGKSLGGEFMNIFEDGRIEQIAAERHPGLIVPLQFLNYEMFRGATLPEKFKNGKQEYEAIRSQILCYAKLGQSIPGFKKLRGTRLYDNFMAVRKNIDNAVNSVACADCVKETQAALKTLAPYFNDLLRSDSNLMDALEKALENMKTSGNASNQEKETGSGSGTGGIRIPSSGKKPSASGSPGAGSEYDGDEDESASTDGDDDADAEDGEGKDRDGAGGKSGEKDGKDGESGDGKDGTGNKDGKDGKTGKGKDGGDKGDKDGKNDDGGKGDKSDKKASKRSSHGHEAGGSNAPSGADCHNISTGSSHSGDDGYASRPLEELSGKPPYSMRELEAALNAGKSLAENATTIISVPQEPANGLTDKEKRSLEDLYRGDSYTSFKEFYYEPVGLSLPTDIAPQAIRLHQRLERILRQKNMELRNQRKGTLDCRSLWKVGTNSPDVFMRRGHKVNADCAVFELIDNSGSMGGNKFRVARTVAGALEVALYRLASLKVSLFNVAGGVEHMTVKDYRDGAQKNKSVAFGSLKNSAINAGGGNKDGYSIRVATKELLKRQEKNKVLIVISDGLPSDYRGGYPQGMKDVRAAVKEAKKLGIIVIALMIEDDGYHQADKESYRTMYGKDVIFCSPSQMLGQFEKLFTSLIKNT